MQILGNRWTNMDSVNSFLLFVYVTFLLLHSTFAKPSEPLDALSTSTSSGVESFDGSEVETEVVPEMYVPSKWNTQNPWPLMDTFKKSSDFMTLEYLRRKLRSSTDNVLFSPIGILSTYLALSTGTNAVTRDEIMGSLRLLSVHDATIEESFKELLRRYNTTKLYDLLLGNMVVLNGPNRLKPQFIDKNSNTYNVVASHQDPQDRSSLTDKLNQWIERMTKGQETSLFQSMDPQTVLMLLNSVYFKGKWTKPFNKAHSRYGFFYNADGSASRVRMMQASYVHYSFVELDDQQLKIIELPFHGNMSMIIFMPRDSVKIDYFADRLTEEKLNIFLASLYKEELSKVSIPSFSLKSLNSLGEIMSQLGIRSVHGETGDLSGISEGPIRLNSALQETVISIDEEGAELSAELKRDSYPISSFILDRPFMFLIRDRTASVNVIAGLVKKMPSF